MAENISLAEIKSLLLRVLDALNVGELCSISNICGYQLIGLYSARPPQALLVSIPLI